MYTDVMDRSFPEKEENKNMHCKSGQPLQQVLVGRLGIDAQEIGTWFLALHKSHMTPIKKFEGNTTNTASTIVNRKPIYNIYYE